MKKIFAFCILALLLSCTKEEKKLTKAKNFIPTNASVIITIDNFNKLTKEVAENEFINSLNASEDFTSFKKQLDFTKNLQIENEVFLSFAQIGTSSEFAFITKQNKNFKDSNKKSATKNYDETSYEVIENKTVFSTIIDSVYIATSSEMLMENIIRNAKSNAAYNNTTFNNLTKIVDPNSTLNVYLKNGTTNDYLNHIFPTQFINNNNWGVFEVDLKNNNFKLSGTIIKHDSLSVNKNPIVHPERQTISSILPEGFDEIKNYGFKEFSNFKDNHFPDISSDFFEDVTELSIATYPEETLLILKKNSFDIENQTWFTDLQEFQNIKLLKNELLSLEKIITNFKGTYVFNVEDYLFFSDDLNFLKTCINNYESNFTFGNTKDHQNMVEDLASESHLLTFKNISALNLKSYPLVAHQLTNEETFSQINTVIKKHVTTPKKGIQITNRIELDNSLSRKPQYAINHRSKALEIVGQDADNNLFLADLEGTILWKKQLDGKILGDIQQIDTYKNNKLQLVFATEKSVYIIDRNGNPIDNFPVKFKSPITQPLGVFDYDKNKRYRFLVTQGNEVIMLNKEGKRVKGFKFKNTKKDITQTPRHFRIGTKDFIVLASNNDGVYILDRTGKTRIKKVNIDTSINGDIMLLKNQICFSKEPKTLTCVDTKGKRSEKTLPVVINDSFMTGERDLCVILKENLLFINDKKIELDFGSYLKPELFNLKNNIYISVTDIESNKVYLFNQSGELLPKFPVYGNSNIDLAIDKKNKTFIVKGEDEMIINYLIN